MSWINGKYEIKLLPHRMEFHHARSGWEAERLESMFEIVQPGWCIWDVGAEEGDFTALYKIWTGGEIVAIEPSPGYWPAIRQTWELNELGPPPICIPAFAGAETQYPPYSDFFTLQHEQDITIAPDGWPYASRWPVRPDYGFRMLCEREKDTPTWSLDDLAVLAVAPMPHAIVMDIEGAEYDALLGCERLCGLFSGVRPILWVSVHETNMMNAYGHEFGDIIRLVTGWDYGYRYLGTHGGEDFWLFSPTERNL